MTPTDLENLNWPTPTAPPLRISEAIRRDCTQNLLPEKPVRMRDRVWLSIGLSGLLFAVLLAIGWLRHPPTKAILVALAGAGAWGLLQAYVLCIGHGRRSGKSCPCWARRVTLIVVPTIFLVYLTIASTSFFTWEQFVTTPHSVHGTVVCGVHALLFGVLATAMLIAIFRRTDPFRPRLTGALTGLAGGLIAAIALDMTCHCLEAWHLWLAHGLTLILLVFGGWVAGRRWLSP
jgi:hypothetical protein